jgi:hypothetical protein
MKEKSPEKSERHFISGRKKSTITLEVSQASPCRPSGKGSVTVKMLFRLEAVGFSELMSKCIIWKINFRASDINRA